MSKLDALAISIRQAAWYRKDQPTFADALAVVRRQAWACTISSMSWAQSDIQKLQHSVLEQLTETLCYAAMLDMTVYGHQEPSEDTSRSRGRTDCVLPPTQQTIDRTGRATAPHHDYPELTFDYIRVLTRWL